MLLLALGDAPDGPGRPTDWVDRNRPRCAASSIVTATPPRRPDTATGAVRRPLPPRRRTDRRGPSA